MLSYVAFLTSLVASVAAHATFQELWINGVDQGSTCVRLPANNNPVTSVTSAVSIHYCVVSWTVLNICGRTLPVMRALPPRKESAMLCRVILWQLKCTNRLATQFLFLFISVSLSSISAGRSLVCERSHWWCSLRTRYREYNYLST